MSAQKNRAPKSCANSYQILQNVNDGSVITRPLRCNRNDCPICSKIYKEEMKERIEAAQKEHNLQYMLTISPELIDKSNAIPINNAALVALRHLQEITARLNMFFQPQMARWSSRENWLILSKLYKRIADLRKPTEYTH